MDFYKSIIESSPDGYAYHKIILDENENPCDYEFIDMNGAFETFTGLKRSDTLGKNISEVLPDISKDEFYGIKSYGNIAINGGSEEFEQFSESLNRWYKVTVYSPEKHYFITHFRDITKRVTEQRALVESELYNKSLIAAVPDLIFVLDAKYVIGDYKASEEDDLAMPEELFMGKNIFEILPEPLAVQIKAEVDVVFSKQVATPIEYQMQNRKGMGLYKCRISALGETKVIAIIENITEGRKIEDKLKESEDNFRTFFETMDDMIIVGNHQGEIFYTNETVTRKLGYSREELRRMHVLDLNPPEKRAEAEQIFGDMFAGKRSACPLPVVKKDGTIIPAETRVWFGKWDGKDCIFGISKDLSIQQAAFDKFHKLFDNNPALMAVSGMPDRKFVDVNTAFLDKMGYSREEIIGKTAQELELFIEEDKQIEIVNILQKEGRIKNIELKVRKKDGQIMVGLFSGEIIDDQKEKAFLTVMTDITEQKQVKEELTNISERLKLATKAAGVGIWEYNLVNGTLIWDDAMYSLYGITKETFSGAYEAWEQGLHPDDLENSRQHINDAIIGVRDFNPEFRVVWQDGSVHHIKANAMVLHDKQGIPIRMYGTNRDVTERIHHELELVKARELAEAANIAKSQFLANMSHEIRTPMNGIFGFLELLQTSNLSLEQKEFIREAKSASEMLLYLINDILDFSKIEAGKLTMEKISFNLRTAIEDAVSLLVPKVSEKGLELHVMVKAGVPEDVIGDPSRLRQILSNLISNAVKFTETGEISVTIDCIDEVNEIALLRFVVKDTGIGISKEAIGNLFQSFNQADASTTRKYGGTGLGLAISKELVKMMDGNIRVESNLGEGSTFCFEVHLKISDGASKSKFEIKKLDNVNVLVVDDNENNRKIVSMHLEGMGCKVFEAKDAGNAIATIVSNASSIDQKISVAVIDYRMPGTSGYELSALLKTIPLANEVKLILLSSSVQKGDCRVAKAHGFSGYLTKPVKRDDLINCIAIVLGLKKEDEQVVTKHTLKEIKNAIKPRILLVEDNEMNRKIVIMMLKSRDMSCDVALDGREALKAVSEKDYDIVFMDCQMPVMSGYESTSKIRANEGDRKHTVIIAMTANAMQGDKAKCIEAGMDDYISKPINFDNMFKLIEANTKYAEKKSEHFDLIDDNINRFTDETGFEKDVATIVFKEYMNYLPDLMKGIKDAIDNNDFEKMGELVHQLKGSSGNLRIASIYELAIKLEGVAMKQKKDQCERLLKELQELFH